MRETVRIVASLVVLREMAVRQVRVGVVFSGNRVLVIDGDHVVRRCEMRGRLRDFSVLFLNRLRNSTHILGLIFHHEWVVAISN